MNKTKLLVTVLVAVASSVVLGMTAGSLFGSSSKGGPSLNGPQIRITDYSAGSAVAAFIQKDGAGNVCLVSGASGAGERSGGCNPASNPLGGHKLLALFTFEGGPSLASVSEGRIAGLAAPGVASVSIVMSDGTTRALQLADRRTDRLMNANYRTFGVRLSDRDFQVGIGPSAVVAYNAAGHIVGQEDLSSVLGN
jgi:hypothetical protein